MFTLMRAKVADYKQWRSGFDSLAGARRASGAIGNPQIFVDHKDPTIVTLIGEWPDEKTARAYFESQPFKDAAAKSGAISIDEPKYLDRA